MNNETVVAYNNNVEIIGAIKDYPYFIFDRDLGTRQSDFRKELMQIQNYYDIYENGASFQPGNVNGDYVPSNLRFKVIRRIINKEARFLFSQVPDMKVEPKGTDEVSKENAEAYQNIVDKVLEQSKFESRLVKAARDCFIGKRIAMVVDISNDKGIIVHFYGSRQFYYETDEDNDRLIKLITFEATEESTNKTNMRYVVTRYIAENNRVWMEQKIYDGMGKEISVLVPGGYVVNMEEIPAAIVLNDGLLDDKRGVSEIEELKHYESTYSKISNSDIDAEGKGMNPIRYTVDMNPYSTENLSSSAGSYWDLKSDQTLDKPSPQVGTLSPDLSYTDTLKETLSRIKTAMYEEVDVPEINEETMQGTITSGKALKALYWPLTVRCDEKMKEWGPALARVIDYIIDFILRNPAYVKEKYMIEDIPSLVDYKAKVVVNYALPEDEQEEQTLDFSAISNKVMSRKTFMKKWYGMTDDQAEQELMQIAVEENMLDPMSMNMQVSGELQNRAMQTQIDENVSAAEAEEI